MTVVTPAPATPPTDDAILAVVERLDGARTGYIAAILAKEHRPHILRRLKRLEIEGKVRRHERYSYPNDFYWEIPK